MGGLRGLVRKLIEGVVIPKEERSYAAHRQAQSSKSDIVTVIEETGGSVGEDVWLW